jgi:hypothetical protein
MAYKMDHRVEGHRTLSAEDLRRVFEAAVCGLRPADVTARKRLHYHLPIVPRGRDSRISQADAEKRALSDAARALPLLWKV